MTTVPQRRASGAATARALWFTAERTPEVLAEAVPEPAGDQVTVRAKASLISPGTEMLVYRGQLDPDDDLGLETCAGSFGFPVKYAYQVVGEVVAVGPDAPYAVGQTVFARHPHQELFTMRPDPMLLFEVPAGLDPRRAVFANLLDVALNCNLDVPVRHGDVVVVYGQGIVGSLTAQLARRTAGHLIVVDPLPHRRELALSWGADRAVTPDEVAGAVDEASAGRGADICVEATGAPAALQSAIDVAGQEATVVVVSFFGNRQVPLVLAPKFHYGRLHLVSSQVSTMGGPLRPRWTMQRRMHTSFQLLRDPSLVTEVTHVLPFGRAAEGYAVLDTDPGSAMGVVLDYAG
ncbi:zinc-dependent alcohol dehydrogenase [Rhizomonospora bruguierae]|uniref:zinc-dependent alcohol dehydrogenase n=1 Tax=Rhizomonospora bruguierae TaxID=1581705 RepID=UPI001BCD5705|nr:zinc-binding alcohol dehydrogenase [Micromonospora sp. NBRC 107566]